MKLKLPEKIVTQVAILGLLYLPECILSKIRDIPSRDLKKNCTEFQNLALKYYKNSGNIYEAFEQAVENSKIAPFSIEYLLYKNNLYPANTIEVLTSESSEPERTCYAGLGHTYSQKIIRPLRRPISQALTSKLETKIKALNFEFKRE